MRKFFKMVAGWFFKQERLDVDQDAHSVGEIGVSMHKVGDVVTIKKLHAGYMSDKCIDGPCKFAPLMKKYCGKKAKITSIKKFRTPGDRYSIDIDNEENNWIDDFFN